METSKHRAVVLLLFGKRGDGLGPAASGLPMPFYLIDPKQQTDKAAKVDHNICAPQAPDDAVLAQAIFGRGAMATMWIASLSLPATLGVDLRCCCPTWPMHKDGAVRPMEAAT